jgi:hypothetical protein
MPNLRVRHKLKVKNWRLQSYNDTAIRRPNGEPNVEVAKKKERMGDLK